MKKNEKIFFARDTENIKKIFVNKKIVLVGGCFDIFHYGHMVFLQKAKKRGDALILLLESDEFITMKKRKKPVHSQMQRAEMLAHVDFVDAVVVLPYFQSDKEYFDLVQKIHPSVIAVTKGDPQIINKTMQAKTIHAKVEIVTEQLQGLSSSTIHPYETVSGN